MRRGTLVTLAIACAMVVSTAGAAFGLSATIGNDAIARNDGPDSWTNFAVVDTNNPAAFDGYFEEVEFWAGRTGTINFVVVNADGIVTFVSGEIAVTATGLQTAPLGEMAGVTAGDNLGYYTAANGVIPYSSDGIIDNTMWQPNNSGLPTVGASFNDIADPYPNNNRVYSMNATIHASSPDLCKKGGWEAYDFKNQGQCIASIVANDNAAPHN